MLPVALILIFQTFAVLSAKSQFGHLDKDRVPVTGDQTIHHSSEPGGVRTESHWRVNTNSPAQNELDNHNSTENGTREKRFAYEDTHEWPNDDSLDYDFDETGETEELTLFEEIARNWQVVFLRGIFLLSGLAMLFMILCCCCNVFCRVCCQSLRDNCVPCRGFLDILTAYYEDPMYKRAKNLAEIMGLKLDYQTYMKIKDRFELDGAGTFNPLGLPHME